MFRAKQTADPSKPCASVEGKTGPVQQQLSLEAQPYPLSSRPKRSAVERSAVCPAQNTVAGRIDPTLCHLDRSEPGFPTSRSWRRPRAALRKESRMQIIK